jgi:hypothetical protein
MCKALIAIKIIAIDASASAGGAGLTKMKEMGRLVR